MKYARSLGLVLSAALVPSLASADVPDPNTTPTTTTTTTTATTPAPTPLPPVVVDPSTPAPTPVVVVNPPAPPPPPAPMYTSPESYEETDVLNAPVFATGALVFGATYGASAIYAATNDHPGADRLYVPLVGPWLALNDWGNCPITSAACDTTTTAKVLLVADGVFQAAGVLTMLDGIFQPTRHVRVTRTADQGIHIIPTGRGFAVLGRF